MIVKKFDGKLGTWRTLKNNFALFLEEYLLLDDVIETTSLRVST